MPSMKSAALPTPELAECANLQQVSEDFTPKGKMTLHFREETADW